MPKGIEIPIDENCRAIIFAVVRSWRINAVPESMQSNAHHFNDIFRAYKFWFNPNRLIDAAMMLSEDFSHAYTGTETFQTQTRSLYQQFTTTECFDLYGYFSNKDSCYLMRTLLAVNRGLSLSWLPPLKDSDKATIKRVYNVLECTMETLREELLARHIKTEPYDRELSIKEITLGRRNRDAVIRIIGLYSKETQATNVKIEKLFNASN